MPLHSLQPIKCGDPSDLDLQNAYNTRAAEGLSYNCNFIQSKYVQGLPVLPSLGLRAEF